MSDINTKQSKSNAVKFATTILSISVTAFVVYFSVGGLKDSSFEKQLEKIARIYNKVTPVEVDSMTVWDSIAVTGNKELTYFFTIKVLEKIEANDSEMETIISTLIELLKNESDLDYLRENNVTFNYIYNDMWGRLISKFTITPQMYR